MERKKLSDIAFFVQCLGVFLFLPSMLAAWDRSTVAVGVPLLPLYLFAVWFLLIVAVYFLSGRLQALDDSEEETQRPRRDSTLNVE